MTGDQLFVVAVGVTVAGVLFIGGTLLAEWIERRWFQ